MALKLQGYVFKDDGTAVSGASVQAYDSADDSTEGSATTTNSDGKWTYDDITTDGLYNIKITSGGSARWRMGADKATFEELYIRNDTSATQSPLYLANATNATSVKVLDLSNKNSTRADNDEIYISFNLNDDGGAAHEFARITAEANDVSNGNEDGELKFGVSVGGSIVNVFTINATTAGVTDMTLDVSGDLVLDADGGDILFKDGGTTFGSATNTSGNLIIKSGTTTALTFSAANVTLGGTATVTTIAEVGSDTDKILISDSGVVKYVTGANLRSYIGAGTGDGDIEGVTAGTGLTGGGSSGTVTVNLALTGLTDTAIANGDYIVFTDATDSNATVKGDLADVATLFAGTGLTASSSVIGVDAAQTQITSVGTIGTGVWNGDAIASTYIAADAITGAKIADDAIDSEHYVDGSIDNAHLADNAVGLAEMAGGTDGNIISYDASGDPVAIATGTDGQVLTSTGAGSPPAFEAAAGGISEADVVALILALG